MDSTRGKRREKREVGAGDGCTRRRVMEIKLEKATKEEDDVAWIEKRKSGV